MTPDNPDARLATERAARLLGGAESLREQTGAAIPSTRVGEVQRDRSAAAKVLEASRFAAEIGRGRIYDPVELIAELPS